MNIASFKKNGFLFIKNYLKTKEEKDTLVRLVQKFEDMPDAPGKWMKYYETKADGSKMLGRIENYADYDPWFHNLVYGDKIMNLVNELMGERAVLYKEKINVKYPGGKGFTPHQDAPAYVTFGQTYHISMMLAIDN